MRGGFTWQRDVAVIHIPVMQWHRSPVDRHCYLVDISTENTGHENKYSKEGFDL